MWQVDSIQGGVCSLRSVHHFNIYRTVCTTLCINKINIINNRPTLNCIEHISMFLSAAIREIAMFCWRREEHAHTRTHARTHAALGNGHTWSRRHEVQVDTPRNNEKVINSPSSPSYMNTVDKKAVWCRQSRHRTVITWSIFSLYTITDVLLSGRCGILDCTDQWAILENNPLTIDIADNNARVSCAGRNSTPPNST